MTDTTPYEPPTLTEVGSVRSLTQADFFSSGQDGTLWFGQSPSNPHHHGLS